MPETRKWLLAIDTATDQAGIAMYDGERLAARTWPGGRQQTTTLLPQMEALARDTEVALEEIGAVAVTIGPGSFTGLRVGLSVAKGLAIANACALIGIPTLDVAAMPYVEANVDCVAVVPAGRGRVVWARYGTGEVSPRNSTFEEFEQAVLSDRASIVVGELDDGQRSRLAANGVALTSRPAGLRQPGVLADLGWHRWHSGGADDPVSLEPAYLHGRPNPR